MKINEKATVSEEQVLFNKLKWEEQQFILKQMRMLQPCELSCEIEESQEHKIPEKIDQWDRQWHYTYYKKEQLNQMQDNIEQLRQKYNKIVDYLEEIE